jgi:serine/threonine protein kinase
VELREGAVIADRFRLIRMLGEGGMGEVWAAQHASLDIPCAVKFIHAESADNPDVRARFEREAKAAAQLRSSNVVQILDYGVFESTPYIAMEYLEGEPLNARLSRRHRLDAIETVRIIAGVGKALTKAHAAGIVHRDLKPENIFLVPDDDSEVAKVLDFGVAKSTTALDSNTRTGALLGTPFYMSPEQAQGIKAIDHRADLWSLAVVAYRCFTGELPFKSEALGDLLIKIVTQPTPIPSQAVAGIP